MALKWDVSNIAGWKNLPENEQDRLWFNLESVALALMPFKFPPGEWAITEENWEEVYTRVFMAEIEYPIRIARFSNQPRPFTPQEIHELIGAKINLGTASTRIVNALAAKVIRRAAYKNIQQFKFPVRNMLLQSLPKEKEQTNDDFLHHETVNT